MAALRARAGPRGRRNERAVLATALVSAGLLAYAALASRGDPDLAGRAALAQAAGRVADGVVLEWQRILRDPPRFVGLAGETLRWEPGVEPAPVAQADGREIAPRRGVASAWSALFGEAERLEREDRAGALALLEELLAKELSPGERAETRLRAIQLALSEGRPELARELVARAVEELEPGDARVGTSYLLLSALAAEPALDEGTRRALGARLVDAWTSGALALPGDSDRLDDTDPRFPHRVALDPAREALRARLAAFCADEAARRRLADEREQRAFAALRPRLPFLPGRPAGDGWAALALGDDVFAWRADEAGRALGLVFRASDLASALLASAREHELVPDGFAIDLDGGARGAVVRDPTPLAGSPLSFRVLHEDPESVVRAHGRRGALVRAALLAMALFTAGAGFATARALRRERRLAELRTFFVANVSHELRTPLASILLMAENLEGGKVRAPAAVARYHATIRREALRLRRLVEDVLDFSRLERGRPLELARERTEIGPWLAALAEDARAWALAAGVELEVAVEELSEAAELDGEALRRAVFNLLENARRHAPGARVVLGARVARAGAGELVLSVEDDGPGIPAAQRERVFEPFVRLAEGDGRAAGVGLGLAIVAEIARAHGGRAVALEREGGGARLELRVPLVAADAALPGSAAPGREDAAGPPRAEGVG